MEVSPPSAGGGVRRMEEQSRKDLFDAKALYVSYQVDKTMGHSVCIALQRKNSGESSAVFTSCSGWVGLDCFPFPSMCADSQNV